MKLFKVYGVYTSMGNVQWIVAKDISTVASENPSASKIETVTEKVTILQ